MSHTLTQIPLKPPGDDVRGFLPDHEGQQLFEWASQVSTIGPLLEIGSYCGRSTIWLGQAAKAHDTVVFALDHHRGSEEHQPGKATTTRRWSMLQANSTALANFAATLRRRVWKIRSFQSLPTVRLSGPAGRAGLAWCLSMVDTVWMPH